MIEAGILDEDEHVELLEGEVVEMSPQDETHARVIHRLTRLFNRALGDEWIVRSQLPLRLRDSEPEPDLAVVRAQEEAASRLPPRSALLIVEVANTSLRQDIERKARIYARARIPEYWVVVVPERAIEVFREPRPRQGAYAERFRAAAADSLTPGAISAVQVSVGSLFR